jgi:hypothetical protein
MTLPFTLDGLDDLLHHETEQWPRVPPTEWTIIILEKPPGDRILNTEVPSLLGCRWYAQISIASIELRNVTARCEHTNHVANGWETIVNQIHAIVNTGNRCIKNDSDLITLEYKAERVADSRRHISEITKLSQIVKPTKIVMNDLAILGSPRSRPMVAPKVGIWSRDEPHTDSVG